MPENYAHLSSSHTFLDAYDEALRKDVEAEIQKVRGHIKYLKPIVDTIVQKAKDSLEQQDRHLPHEILVRRLSANALLLVYVFLSQGSKIRNARDSIVSYGSIVLVGAGISWESGIPLSRVLTQLLAFCGASDYEELKTDREKCSLFKSEFRKVCRKKEPGISHKKIVTNFPKHIWEIICLNWDDLIERASVCISGEKLKKVNRDEPVSGKNFLWKFHGDVEDLGNNEKVNGRWIFPSEEGHVFQCFLDYVEKHNIIDSMFTFIIAGYSEGEEAVYKNIIQRFEKERRRPTFRIGLDIERVHDSCYIVGPADYVLEEILPIPLAASKPH